MCGVFFCRNSTGSPNDLHFFALLGKLLYTCGPSNNYDLIVLLFASTCAFDNNIINSNDLLSAR